MVNMRISEFFAEFSTTGRRTNAEFSTTGRQTNAEIFDDEATAPPDEATAPPDEATAPPAPPDEATAPPPARRKILEFGRGGRGFNNHQTRLRLGRTV